MGGKPTTTSKWELEAEVKTLKSQLEAAGTGASGDGTPPAADNEASKGEELSKARQQLAEIKKLGPSWDEVAKDMEAEIEKRAKEARESKPEHWHRNRLWEQGNRLQKTYHSTTGQHCRAHSKATG